MPGILPIVLILMGIATIIISIRMDAEDDADRLARNEKINHLKDIIIWGGITNIIVITMQCTLLLVDFPLNKDFIVSQIFFVLFYTGWRYLRFDLLLNRFRGLKDNYVPELGPYSSVFDKFNAYFNIKPTSPIRWCYFAVMAFFLMHNYLLYFEPFYPNLAHNFGLSAAIFLGIAGIPIIVNWFKFNNRHKD